MQRNRNVRSLIRRASSAALCCALSAAAHAFTPLNFPAPSQVSPSTLPAWREATLLASPDEPPVLLSFAIAPDFMAGREDVTQAEARQAVLAALATWSEASRGRVRFVEAPWPAVMNAGIAPPVDWEGPSLADWVADQARPPEDRLYPPEARPGWGANIEFFSRPQGWSIVSETRLFQMTNQNLGFAVVNTLGVGIRSSDLYINASRSWRVEPTGPGRDLESVILHELGHCLGFDHPDEAAANASVNLDPISLEDGFEGCGCEVMVSAYQGTKRQLTVDDVGALAFLYPPAPGDLNGDRTVSMADLTTALAINRAEMEAGPYEARAGDLLTTDGRIDSAELTVCLALATGQGPIPAAELPAGAGLSPLGVGPTGSSGLEISISATLTPSDIGKGGTVRLDLALANAGLAPIQSWQLALLYDPAVFLNARRLPGAFPPDGLPIDNLATPGLALLGVLGASPATTAAGVIASLEFDVSLPDAVDAVMSVLAIQDAEVVVNLGGQIVVFGTQPGQTLTLVDGSAFASDLDADSDGVVRLDDLYAWALSPIDTDRDGDVDADDRRRMVECLRSGEATEFSR